QTPLPRKRERRTLAQDEGVRFETLEDGGRVAITTNDRRALEAIHEFLRYQIREHHTGDSTRVAKPNDLLKHRFSPHLPFDSTANLDEHIAESAVELV